MPHPSSAKQRPPARPTPRGFEPPAPQPSLSTCSFPVAFADEARGSSPPWVGRGPVVSLFVLEIPTASPRRQLAVPRPQPPSGGARPRLAGLGRLPTGPAGLRQALALGGLGGGQGGPRS